MVTAKIHPAVAALAARMIEVRRKLHRRPELSFEEHETGKLVVEELRDLRAEVRHPVARTGVLATMTNGDGPCIALRADMDALPLQETSSHPYRSEKAGVMHACGHDGHIAMLLGAARALDGMRGSWRGTVKLLFQPAEEGHAGAVKMIEDGVLDSPRPAAAFGAHLWNYQDLGTVGVQAGPVMAATDELKITVRGKGGHGAAPQGTVDAVLVASQLVVALQSVVSRNVNPLDSAVITIGQIKGGYNFNIIADEVALRGTVRSYREEVRTLLKERIAAVCDGVARAFGASISIDYRDGYPPTVNDAQMTAVVQRAAERVVGDKAEPPYLSMGGEDMAYYLREVPGCYFFVGSGKPGVPRVPHHASHFDFEEKALEIGASVFVEVVLDMLPVR
jgi:amidohydrolase